MLGVSVSRTSAQCLRLGSRRHPGGATAPSPTAAATTTHRLKVEHRRRDALTSCRFSIDEADDLAFLFQQQRVDSKELALQLDFDSCWACESGCWAELSVFSGVGYR